MRQAPLSASAAILPRFDASNPLAPNVGLWLPGVSRSNLVGPTAFANAGTGADPSARGNIKSGMELYTSGKYVETGLTARAFSRFTLFIVMTPTSAPTGTGFSSVWQTGQCTINWNHASAGYQGSMTLYNGGAYPTCNFGTFVSGARTVIAATYDGTSIRTYKDRLSANTLAAGNNTAGVSLNSPQFLGGTGGTVAWDGAIEMLLWDDTRAYRHDEIMALMNDPYILFSMRRELDNLLWTTVPAASFKSAWARNANTVLGVRVA